MVDDPDAVGEDVGLLEVLGGQEDRDPVLAREPRHLRPERVAALRVEAGRRLVEKEDARLVDQRQREVETALHPARVGLHFAVGGLREPDALEQRFASLPALRLGHAVQRRLQAQVLAAGEQRVERGLLQRRADRGAHLRSFAHHVEARDARGAGRRREQGREHVHGRRLAGAVRAEEAVDLARGHREVDPVDGPDPALELARQASAWIPCSSRTEARLAET